VKARTNPRIYACRSSQYASIDSDLESTPQASAHATAVSPLAKRWARVSAMSTPTVAATAPSPSETDVHVRAHSHPRTSPHRSTIGTAIESSVLD